MPGRASRPADEHQPRVGSAHTPVVAAQVHRVVTVPKAVAPRGGVLQARVAARRVPRIPSPRSSADRVIVLPDATDPHA